jgi:hypothetical protein
MKYHLGDLVFLVNGDCEGDGEAFENAYCGRIDAFLVEEHGQLRIMILASFCIYRCTIN